MIITNYIAIKSNTLAGLIIEVNSLIHKGYVPQGGVCTLVEDLGNGIERTYFIQAMINPTT
ncbi:MAG: hypothetical protein WC554_13625 [Clostridia bacterium]|jgi:hypothetical protein